MIRSKKQDVGQVDMYVKMYDDLVRPEGHNPTIGILLCADTDEDVAHYSVLSNNDHLLQPDISPICRRKRNCVVR